MTDTAEQLYLALLQKVILNEINPENGARIKYLVDLVCFGASERERNEFISHLANLHRDDEDSRQAIAEIFATKNWWTMNLGFPLSMIGPKRLENVRYAVETVISERVLGDLVETGVWRGGACIMMKAIVNLRRDGRAVYLCDSFQGLPQIDDGPDAPLKLHDNPLLAVPIADVRSHFARLGLLDDRVFFVEGWFNDTMPRLAKGAPEKVSVLRLDGDYYVSTITVLNHLYDKVSAGGFVIIDDYFTYEQCRRAVTEFRDARGISDAIIDIDGDGAYWRKS
jgi:hypothetical protein